MSTLLLSALGCAGTISDEDDEPIGASGGAAGMAGTAGWAGSGNAAGVGNWPSGRAGSGGAASGGSAGAGNAAGGGTAGAGNAPGGGGSGGGSGNAPGGGGVGNAPGGGGSGSAPGGGGSGGGQTKSCPASGPVNISMWTSAPWVAPKSGPAETSITLSKETWKHYQRFQLDLDFDVTQIQKPYNCFLELRNVGAAGKAAHPWRYFSVCTKNDSGKKAIYIVYGAKTPSEDFAYLTKSFTLQNNTSYHFNIVYDAKALQTSMTLTPSGGQPVTLQTAVTSSIVPQGSGLRLLVGFNTNHPDYPNIKPPWGWSFRNLKVSMTPGGPYGASAPACP